MRVVDGKAEFVTAKSYKEESNAGDVTCACGHSYTFDGDFTAHNVAECYGRVVPICPKCEGIPDQCRMNKQKRIDG